MVSEGQLSFQVPCQCLRVVAQLVTWRDAIKSCGDFAGDRDVVLASACLLTCARKQEHNGDSNPTLLIRYISLAGLSGKDLLQDPCLQGYNQLQTLGSPWRSCS